MSANMSFERSKSGLELEKAEGDQSDESPEGTDDSEALSLLNPLPESDISRESSFVSKFKNSIFEVLNVLKFLVSWRS